MIPMGNYLPRVKDAVLCSDKRASFSITVKACALRTPSDWSVLAYLEIESQGSTATS